LPFSLLSILPTKLVVVYLTSTDLTTKQNLDMLTTIATANTNIQSLALDSSCVKGEADEVIVGVCYMVNMLVFSGGGGTVEGRARVMYSALISSNTLVDCNVMCGGIATENMLEKYPSADTLLNIRTRCYFLSCFRHRLEQRRFCLDMILGDP
jgi:hypothetical protein